MIFEPNQFAKWISATDSSQVERVGNWEVDQLRGSFTDALITLEENASVSFSFIGENLILCLDTLTPPNYGAIEAGFLEVYVDGKFVNSIYPLSCADEVRIAKNLTNEFHQVKIVHRSNRGRCGCRIRGFYLIDIQNGDLQFVVNGEHNFSFYDVRAIVKNNGKVVRNTLLRNWLTGQCCLAGLPPGKNYSLEIIASGWESWCLADIEINQNQVTLLPPIFLVRKQDEIKDAFKFPKYGHPKIHKAGDSFRIKFKAHDAKIEEMRLVRWVGPAKISRDCIYEEDCPRMGVFLGLNDEAMYYLCEGKVTLSKDLPCGLYDIEILLNYGGKISKIISRRSIYIVSSFPKDPVFLAYGHMDAWGQGPAEYLEQIMAVANIIAPDLVLGSNSCNPAYEAGALFNLEVPFIINFGNHQSPGQELWFGDSIGVVDYGPNLSIVNFGYSWDRDLSEVKKILEDRSRVSCKIIHAYEYGAPVNEILDPYQISLVHDGHGPGPKVQRLGKTPTIRVGKENNSSFRIIRFKNNQLVSYTYANHEYKAVPFPRNGLAPIRVEFDKQNDGSQNLITAQVTNDLSEEIPNARIVFVVAKGKYKINKGKIESEIDSDDGMFTVVTVRINLAPKSNETIKVVACPN